MDNNKIDEVVWTARMNDALKREDECNKNWQSETMGMVNGNLYNKYPTGYKKSNDSFGVESSVPVTVVNTELEKNNDKFVNLCDFLKTIAEHRGKLDDKNPVKNF